MIANVIARGKSLIAGNSNLHVSLANLVLRMASLVGKFGLSLVIARYLALSDLGIYGIVFAFSMIMVVLLGGRIDHELGRQIVLDSDVSAAALMRDQTVFFVINFIVALPVFILVGSLGFEGFGLAIALCTWAICCLESYANLMFINTNALGRPLAASTVFFVRSGLWALIVIALMLFFPATRKLWTVFGLWIAGTSLSIWINLNILNVASWPPFREIPPNWRRLTKALRVSFLIWVGSIGLAGGSYLDRIVLSGLLNLDAVGVATFYSSFSMALVSLVSSSVLAVVFPKLVRFASEHNWPSFNAELLNAGKIVAVMAIPITIGIMVVVPYLGFLLQKPEFFIERYTLWALMIAALFRLAAEVYFDGLYACRNDTPIWTGNLAFLALSLIANIAFIKAFGLIGLGYASILASVFLLIYRMRGLVTTAHNAGGNPL